MGNMAQEEESVKATPLAAMAEAFEELSKLVKTCPSYHLRLITFCDACSLVSVLFGCLGIAFKFAELEYVSKVLFFHLNRSLSLSLSLYGCFRSLLSLTNKNLFVSILHIAIFTILFLD